MSYSRPWARVQVGDRYVLRSRGALDRPTPGTPPAATVYQLAGLDARTFYEPGPSRDDLVFSTENALQIPGDPTSFVGPTGSLTRYPASGDGDLTVSSNGQVIQDLDIYGSIRLLAYSGVKIRNCRIRGTLARGTDTACVVASNENLRGAVIEDCALVGRGNEWCIGMRGGNYTIRRCEITALSDGIGLTAQIGNVQILGNWIHGCLYNEWTDTTPDMPYAGSYYTHCDCIQFHRGKDYIVRGNYLGGVRAYNPANGDVWGHHTGHLADIQAADDFYNSCIMLKQEVDSTDANRLERLLIEQNVFHGGNCGINHPSGNGNDFSSTTVRDNIFVRFPMDSIHWYILKSPSLLAMYSNNVYADTGLPVPIGNGGG